MDGVEMTALQKHVSFFDRNKDGVIYPWETFQGLRAIGAGLRVSIAGAVFIHASLASKTRTGVLTSPLLPIYVKNISRGKHGSDSGAYDDEGRISHGLEMEFSKKEKALGYTAFLGLYLKNSRRYFKSMLTRTTTP